VYSEGNDTIAFIPINHAPLIFSFREFKEPGNEETEVEHFCQNSKCQCVKACHTLFSFKKQCRTLLTYTKVQSYNNPACFGI